VAGSKVSKTIKEHGKPTNIKWWSDLTFCAVTRSGTIVSNNFDSRSLLYKRDTPNDHSI
jgi:hypothetical protein